MKFVRKSITAAAMMLSGGVASHAADVIVPGTQKQQLPGITNDNNLPAKPGVGSRGFGTENLPAKPDGTPPGSPSMGTTSPDLPAKPGDKPKTPR
jgi:hypothetical protein